MDGWMDGWVLVIALESSMNFFFSWGRDLDGFRIKSFMLIVIVHNTD
jgi:hypothetical protein